VALSLNGTRRPTQPRSATTRSTTRSTEADGCDLGYTPECCGFGAPSGGYSCEFDFGVSVCGANGWTCPNGGNMAPACSGICMDYPDAEGDASAPGDATDGKE
jgi:hypothetical protein